MMLVKNVTNGLNHLNTLRYVPSIVQGSMMIPNLMYLSFTMIVSARSVRMHT